MNIAQVPAGEAVYLMIWTTTPWTLPANMATAVHPEGDYALCRMSWQGRERYVIVGAKLVQRIAEKATAEVVRIGSATGAQLEEAGVKYRHPFIDRISPVVTAEYVTFEDGTGLVHTAPGHGEDDYATGIKKGLEVYNPVLHNGRFDDTVPEWLRGVVVWDANKLIVERLRADGTLYHEEPITHSYPHDWRSKTPTIFRATEQWFIALDKPFGVLGEIGVRPRSLRQRALDAVNAGVEFVPRWGQARIKGMLEGRPDWCISRQRAWGLPIPVFYNEKGEALLTAESVRAVSERFAEKGSDAWFTDSPAQLLGSHDPGPNFPKDQLRKEKDIFDVWFESGSSWHAVLQARETLQFPADLYLEGSDQHRGWFQLSLLPSLGATGQAPFKQVLTHGFIVKPDGTKVSKSDKEYVTATQEVNRHGADLLRLWCSSVDYQGDVPVSPKVIQEFGDKYRKIRNTLRYLLSNLYDFDPVRHGQEIPQQSLDGWAMAELDTLIGEVTAGYDTYQLHRVFRLLHDFCSVQISSVYGNAMKDRLYCEAPDSPLRRRSQTVMHRMVVVLTKLLAPVLVFTAEEAWEQIAHKPAGEQHLASVHLTRLPEVSGQTPGDEQREEWRLLMQLREQALAQLDGLKKEAGLNKAIDAEIVYEVNDDALRRALQAYGADLEDLAGAGYHSFAESSVAGPPATVKVLDRREMYAACARSWKRRPDVGEDPAHPDLSLRDARAVSSGK
jgi:isoleucyl-tRNA synthetase